MRGTAPPKLRLLSGDARFSPALCLKALLDDIEAGRVTPDRVVLVVDEGSDLHVHGSGPGMGDVVPVIGLLQLGIAHLAALRLEPHEESA